MNGFCVPVPNDGPGYTTPPTLPTAHPIPPPRQLHSFDRSRFSSGRRKHVDPGSTFFATIDGHLVAVVAGVYVVRYRWDGPERYKVMNNARQLIEPLERCRKMPLSQRSAEYPSRSEATVAVFLLR
jgi:hypothetical protein